MQRALLRDPGILAAPRLAQAQGQDVRDLLGRKRELPLQEERARLLREVGSQSHRLMLMWFVIPSLQPQTIGSLSVACVGGLSKAWNFLLSAIQIQKQQYAGGVDRTHTALPKQNLLLLPEYCAINLNVKSASWIQAPRPLSSTA